MFKFSTPTRTLVLAAVAASALAIAGCGDSNDQSSSNSDGNAADAMFVNGMIPHHQAAIDMAELAQENADHAQIKELADDIITSQSAEIKQMNEMKADLPDTRASAMSQSMMDSMNGDVDDVRGAQNFDKAFLLAMIPHHEMAVQMAQSVKSKGESEQVGSLAEAIIAAQQREIKEMRAWLKDWYGVTAPETSMGSMDDMGHSGMH